MNLQVRICHIITVDKAVGWVLHVISEIKVPGKYGQPLNRSHLLPSYHPIKSGWSAPFLPSTYTLDLELKTCEILGCF